MRYPRNAAAIQTAHQLGAMLYAYANDHEGAYPVGTSSTEVFQQLLDGGYASEPEIFYFPMPGKVKPVSGQKLKPENVSWDCTANATQSSPKRLPLVFLTGFRVTYQSGTAAVRLPPAKLGSSGFIDWFLSFFKKDEVRLYTNQPGIAVYYIDNNSMFLIPKDDISQVPMFTPSDFKPDGKNYVQLTPEDPSPPR